MCFLYCVKECRVVENIENEEATWKIITTKQSWYKFQDKIFQSVLIAPVVF